RDQVRCRRPRPGLGGRAVTPSRQNRPEWTFRQASRSPGGSPTEVEARGSRRISALLPAAPADQAGADAAGIDAERVADVLEGKRPARVGGCNPPFDLACEGPSAAVRVRVERGESVLEHGQHETLLGLEGEGRAP